MQANEYRIEVLRVVDGDTILADINLGFGVFIAGYLRLAGINAPEVGQDGFREATEFVRDMCSKGSKVSCKGARKDKYGRFVADILVDSKSVSEALLSAGLVSRYVGTSPDEDAPFFD